ncbi:MAG: hypothetical protein ACKOPC_07625, partial [Methylocystis sp.]
MLAIASCVIDFGIIDVSIAEKSNEFFYKRLPLHECCIVVRRGNPLESREYLSIEDLLPYSYCGPNPSRWAIDHAGIGAKIFGQADRDYGQVSGSFNAHTFYTAINIIITTNSFSVIPKAIFRKNAAAQHH